jgi:hypothetical protein
VDPNKQKGNMSSYAFFGQTCQVQPDTSVSLSEWWKSMDAKEKGKSEDTATVDRRVTKKK